MYIYTFFKKAKEYNFFLCLLKGVGIFSKINKYLITETLRKQQAGRKL